MPETKDAKFWQAELELSAKHERKYRERARKVVKTYRDEQDISDTRFNILWSNTQTQLPALYSSTPKPVAKRRHRQEGPVARDAAQMLERALTYSLDPGGAYDFDRVGKKCTLDFLLPGRMVARVKYHPILSSKIRFVESDEQPGEFDFEVNEEGKFIFEEKYDELVDEEVRIYHVPWDQYRQAVAKHWEDVWWVAYGNNFLTREEIIDQFGPEHADVPLTHLVHIEEKEGASSEEDAPRMVHKAQVWEIWDKDDRKVCAMVEGYDKLLMSEGDPLGLRGFYPGPEPALIVETPDSTIPIPEYTLYQYQAQELNLITQRIENLVKAMKLAGLYPGSQEGIVDQVLKSKENALVPVEDWGAITERGGLGGMIEWLPLRDVADAWQRLMVYRETLVQAIYDLTGISDIQRGSTDPRETKGAQQIKASFASRRLLPKQQETQRFFRDLFRIQAEIIAEHFQTDTLLRMANMQPSESAIQARELIRDDALRSFVIDIETDSTIAPEEALERQGVAEFVAAMSQYLNQVFPIVQAQPAAMGPLGKMLLWISRKFSIARDAEDELEEFLQTFDQLPQQQNQAEQAEIAAKQAQAQADQQIKVAETQADIARKDAESAAKIRREDNLAQLQAKKLALEIQEKEQAIRLSREETEAKLILDAVDKEAKRTMSQGQEKQSNEKAAVSLNIGETQPKKIELVRDNDGKISGAEVTPIEKSE